MSLVFALLAGVTLGSAVAAVTVRNLVHAALFLALSLAALGLVYLHLAAEFIGLAQILVYVGAVAVLIVFAVLLVRGTEASGKRTSRAPWLGALITAAFGFGLLWAVIQSPLIRDTTPRPAPEMTVRNLGERLMHDYVVPLQALGLLLTAATLSAALIALPRADGRSIPPAQRKP